MLSALYSPPSSAASGSQQSDTYKAERGDDPPLCRENGLPNERKHIMSFHINIIEKRCKGCGICVEYCPKHVYTLVPGETAKATNAEACVGCHLCELRCPDIALEVTKE